MMMMLKDRKEMSSATMKCQASTKTLINQSSCKAKPFSTLVDCE